MCLWMNCYVTFLLNISRDAHEIHEEEETPPQPAVPTTRLVWTRRAGDRLAARQLGGD